MWLYYITNVCHGVSTLTVARHGVATSRICIVLLVRIYVGVVNLFLLFYSILSVHHYYL